VAGLPVVLYATLRVLLDNHRSDGRRVVVAPVDPGPPLAARPCGDLEYYRRLEFRPHQALALLERAETSSCRRWPWARRAPPAPAATSGQPTPQGATEDLRKRKKAIALALPLAYPELPPAEVDVLASDRRSRPRRFQTCTSCRRSGPGSACPGSG
jgi:hypothetical protein